MLQPTTGFQVASVHSMPVWSAISRPSYAGKSLIKPPRMHDESHPRFVELRGPERVDPELQFRQLLRCDIERGGQGCLRESARHASLAQPPAEVDVYLGGDHRTPPREIASRPAV